MKKSLIALAIAAASTSAFASGLYGQARLSLTSVDGGDITMADRVSRVGLKGSEDLGGGMSAFYHFEKGLSFADSNWGGQRLAFAGVGGSFGKVYAGSVFMPYKMAGTASLVEDTAADMVAQSGGVLSVGFDAAQTGVVYISPDFNGLQVAVGMEGTTLNGSSDTSYSVSYKNGPLTASYAAEEQGTTDATKLNLGYTMGDIGIKFTNEKANGKKANVIGVTYAAGANTLFVNYADTDNAMGSRMVIGNVHSLSKRTQLVAAYADDKAGTLANGAITVQLNHSF